MTGTPKILVVDDEVRMCESLKILLGGRNCQIETCPSAREAMSWLEKNHCDLMLLDLMMPEMDGYQLLDHVKAGYPDVTVIMMTGHASIESAVEALKRGAHDYLGKPFEHDELVKRVQNALDQKRLRAETGHLPQEVRDLRGTVSLSRAAFPRPHLHPRGERRVPLRE